MDTLTVECLHEEWMTIGDKILDIQQFIRMLHRCWNNTPIEKVMIHLIEAYKYAGDVEETLAAGWNVESEKGNKSN